MYIFYIRNVFQLLSKVKIFINSVAHPCHGLGAICYFKREISISRSHWVLSSRPALVSRVDKASHSLPLPHRASSMRDEADGGTAEQDGKSWSSVSGLSDTVTSKVENVPSEAAHTEIHAIIN